MTFSSCVASLFSLLPIAPKPSPVTKKTASSLGDRFETWGRPAWPCQRRAGLLFVRLPLLNLRASRAPTPHRPRRLPRPPLPLARPRPPPPLPPPPPPADNPRPPQPI